MSIIELTKVRPKADPFSLNNVPIWMLVFVRCVNVKLDRIVI